MHRITSHISPFCAAALLHCCIVLRLLHFNPAIARKGISSILQSHSAPACTSSDCSWDTAGYHSPVGDLRCLHWDPPTATALHQCAPTLHCTRSHSGSPRPPSFSLVQTPPLTLVTHSLSPLSCITFNFLRHSFLPFLYVCGAVQQTKNWSTSITKPIALSCSGSPSEKSRRPLKFNLPTSTYRKLARRQIELELPNKRNPSPIRRHTSPLPPRRLHCPYTSSAIILEILLANTRPRRKTVRRNCLTWSHKPPCPSHLDFSPDVSRSPCTPREGLRIPGIYSEQQLRLSITRSIAWGLSIYGIRSSIRFRGLRLSATDPGQSSR